MTDTSTEMLALADLDERIVNAEHDASENHKLDPNCYGAGYDGGYLAALKEIREELRSASAGGRPDREAIAQVIRDQFAIADLGGNEPFYITDAIAHIRDDEDIATALEIIESAATSCADAILSLHPVGPDTFSVGAFESLRGEVCAAIAFLSRDSHTDRLQSTVDGLIKRLAEADKAARAALPLPGEKDVQTRFAESESTTHRESVTELSLRERMCRMIGSRVTHSDDRGDENVVLHDAFAGDYAERTEALYQLVDDLLAEVSLEVSLPAPLSTDASACPDSGFLRSSLNQNNLSTPPSAGDGWPTIPDDDTDFTPDLARKIIAKYQEMLRAAHPAPAEGLREALRDCPCPRPCNTDPDDLTIGGCNDLGHCGCKYGAALSHPSTGERS